jgi:hypothetical protein
MDPLKLRVGPRGVVPPEPVQVPSELTTLLSDPYLRPTITSPHQMSTSCAGATTDNGHGYDLSLKADGTVSARAHEWHYDAKTKKAVDHYGPWGPLSRNERVALAKSLSQVQSFDSKGKWARMAVLALQKRWPELRNGTTP